MLDKIISIVELESVWSDGEEGGDEKEKELWRQKEVDNPDSLIYVAPTIFYNLFTRLSVCGLRDCLSIVIY